MIKRLFLAMAMLELTINPVSAQTLTVEELRAQIDGRIEQMNPYAELLNDPDPERSMAAMQIMLESDDDVLKDMALEFGLLSGNPQVRRTAFEAYLATAPNLTVRLDGGSANEESRYQSRILGLAGTVDADGIGYFVIPVGDYISENRCYLYRGASNCAIMSNGDGIFVSPRGVTGRGTLIEDGTISGNVTIDSVSVPVPFTIRLIE